MHSGAIGDEPLARSFDKSALALQLGTTHIRGLGQRAAVQVAADDDVPAWVACCRAVGGDATVHHNAAAVGQQVHRAALNA